MTATSHRRRRRRSGAVLGAVLATAALSACTTRPGAAATVGSGRIQTSDLASSVDAIAGLPAVAGVSRVDLQRDVLSGLIAERVDEAVASSDGVTVTPTQVTAAVDQLRTETGASTDDQALGALLASTSPSGEPQTPSGYAGLETTARDNLLLAGARSAYVAGHPPTEASLQALFAADPQQFNSADLSVIVLTDQTKAAADYAKLQKNPGLFADIARIDSLSTQTAQAGGEVGVVPAGQLGTQVDQAVYAAQPGEVLPPLADEGAIIILKVNKLTVEDYASARPQLLAEAKNPQGPVALAAVQQQRRAAASRLHVWVNPRFGSWAGPDSLPAAGSSGDSVKAPSNPLAIPGGGSNDTEAEPDPGTTGQG